MINKISAAFRRKRQPAVLFEETFQYRTDDFVIVSYPKSGSTWLRFIIANLINKETEMGANNIDFLRTQLSVPEISKQALDKGVNFNALPSPRILRSHTKNIQSFPHVIYLMRDGRDVLVSYYYHYLKFNDFMGTISDFISSDTRKPDWHDHVNSCLFNNSNLSNLYVIRYETILIDPFSVIQGLLAFVGLVRTSDQVNAAIQSSSFHKMKALENQKGLGYVEQGNTRIPFVRAAKVGQWREIFSEEDKALVKRTYGDTLIKAGYEVSYSW